MRRRQAYAIKEVQRAEPLKIPSGFVLCPHCEKLFRSRGIYHHKIKCQKMQE